MPSYMPVAAVLRGLDVLRAVNELGPADLKSLHAATGCDKSTLVRMLETLMHAGFVSQDRDGRAYAVTGKVLLLSAGFDRSLELERLLTPILSRFRSQIGWPSDFAMLDGTEMIVVRTSRDEGPLSFNRRRGFRAPVLETSIGRAYLAYCTEEERRELIGRLRAGVGDGTQATRSEEEIEAIVETVREQGFATMDERYSAEQYEGAFWAIAVPVQKGERLFGSLNLMLLRKAVSEDRARRDLLGPLQKTATQLANDFVAFGI